MLFPLADKKNASNMEEIQSSIFVLCLDKSMTGNDQEVAPRNVTASQVLHGGGAKLNSGNRWYDKTLEVIGFNSSMAQIKPLLIFQVN